MSDKPSEEVQMALERLRCNAWRWNDAMKVYDRVGEDVAVVEAALRAAQARIKELKKEREEEVRLMRGVVEADLSGVWRLLDSWRPIGWVDHACRECLPHGEILIDGFRCAYHVVKALAALKSKSQPGGTNG